MQDRMNTFPSPLAMLRSSPIGPPFPYPPEYTNWRDEQSAWASTAILFDQSFHMTDLFISGPDVVRLLNDTSINGYSTFGTGKAKQYIAVNEEGYLIGDSILVGLSENEVTLAGFEHSLNWLEFHAQKGGYDVELSRDPNSHGEAGSKRLYRYELEGPAAWKILEEAAGQKLEHIKFFNTGKIRIAGHSVWALNHTMGGVPGAESTGLELFGPFEQGEAVVNAILNAGANFGLRRGGAISYASTTVESGWIGAIVPAVYTSPTLADYRQWLPDTSLENFAITGLEGSYNPSSIEGYYLTPWDVGYHRVIRYDHDFIGRSALAAMGEGTPRKKAWLTWNEEDTHRVLVESELTYPNAPKGLNGPTVISWDEVYVGDQVVGVTEASGFTVNLGGWASNASLEPEFAVDGAQVEILWGDFDGGKARPFVTPHTQTRIRATVHTNSPTAES